MEISSKKIRQNWILIILVMVTGLFLVGLYVSFSGAKIADQASSNFYDYNLKDRKLQIQTEVHNRLDEIAYENNNLHNTEKEIISNKVLSSASILESFSIDNNQILEVDQRTIVNEYLKLAQLDEDYYYFILRGDGTNLHTESDPTIDNLYMYNVQDIKGTYFIQDMLKSKDTEEGIFLDYYWPKSPETDAMKKTAFCYYIEAYDVIIGTGFYHEDIKLALQDKIYTRLQSYYENKDNYIFVIQYDSIAKVFGNPDFIDTPTGDLPDIDGASIHKKFKDMVETNGSGFVSYQFYRRGESRISEKTSYVHHLGDWDAYIGLGFYMDDLRAEVDNNTRLFNNHVYNQTIFIVIGLMLVSVFVYWFIRRGSFLEKEYMKQGDIVFEDLFFHSIEGIIVVSLKGQLMYQNNNAKRLFHGELGKYLNGFELELELKEADVYTFSTESERTYYVTVRRESVSFRGHDSYVYFVHDITTNYLKSNELAKLALTDDLTGLGNRRALRNDFEDLSYDLEPDENVILAMIDIDYFKKVNDSYGHRLGDQVLVSLADIIKNRIRYGDVFYRYGGEEFILILRNISLGHAKELVEHLNLLFNEKTSEKYSIPCTFSGGMVSIAHQHRGKPIQDFVDLADKLLYEAKITGRNRMVTEEDHI